MRRFRVTQVWEVETAQIVTGDYLSDHLENMIAVYQTTTDRYANLVEQKQCMVEEIVHPKDSDRREQVRRATDHIGRGTNVDG